MGERGGGGKEEGRHRRGKREEERGMLMRDKALRGRKKIGKERRNGET